jgi:hypothetical protein
MIATGMGAAPESIEGLEAALENPDSTVFSTIDRVNNKVI